MILMSVRLEEYDPNKGAHNSCHPLDTLEVVIQSPQIISALNLLEEQGTNIVNFKQCCTCGTLIVKALNKSTKEKEVCYVELEDDSSGNLCLI